MSQSLTKEESQYPMYKLEFLASHFYNHCVSWLPIFEHLDIKSDKSLVTSVLTSIWLDVIGHWWVASLASYSFNVQYKVGKTNIEADTLSCIDWSNSFSMDSVQTILNAAMEGMIPQAVICAYSTQACSSPVEEGNGPRTMSVKDWTESQRADQDVNEVIKLYQERCLNTIKFTDYGSKDLKLLLRQRPKLWLRSLACIWNPIPFRRITMTCSWSSLRNIRKWYSEVVFMI